MSVKKILFYSFFTHLLMNTSLKAIENKTFEAMYASLFKNELMYKKIQKNSFVVSTHIALEI